MCCYMDDNGFLEVEIFILENIVFGVEVWLFVIYYNVLNIDMYMWIVIELWFKCLIVGGMEWVYELGWIFCNEGMDLYYNFEFDMMEIYVVYFDFNDVMKEMEGIFKVVVGVVVDDLKIIY